MTSESTSTGRQHGAATHTGGGPPVADDHRLTPRQRKAVVAGSTGDTVEWVDRAVYATFSSVFAGRFFPSDMPETKHKESV